MAVEIKEIVVKAILTDGSKEVKPVDPSSNEKEEMIQECVNQVLKVLRNKERR